MNFIDRSLLKIANRRLHVNQQKNISKKSGGMSGGVPFAYIQDMVPYSIGDSAKNYVNNGYSKNALVYSLINLITSTAAKAQFTLMDITDPDESIEVKQHPFLELLKHPAPMYGRREFIVNTLGFLLLTGEAFIYKNRGTLSSNKGNVLQLIIMPPQYMRVHQDKLTGLPDSYRYYDGKTSMDIAPEDVIFMKYWNPEGSIRGVSPLKAGREVLAQSNDSYKANRKLTINGGPPGILSIDDSTGIDWDDAQRDKVLEKFRENYTVAGSENYGIPLITNGKWQWTPTGLKADDLMLKEGQRMSLRDLCNLYNVSSQLLNDPDNKTYNNMQEARHALITNCVIPQLHLWCDFIMRDLLAEYSQTDNKKYELFPDKQCWEEIREDEATQVTMLSQAWWMTLNEKRKVQGLAPLTIDEGDDIYVPINMMPISTNTDASAQLRNAHAAAQQGVAESPGKPTVDANA